MGQISDLLESNPEEVLANYKKPEVEQKEEKNDTPIKEEAKAESQKSEEGKQVVEPEGKKKEPDPVPVDRVKIISELFEENFDSEEKAVEAIRSLKLSKTEKAELEKQLEELKKGVDGRDFFVSESEYHRQLLLKQFPDYDPELITRVIGKDSSKMTDLDAIRLHRRITDSDIYQSDAEVDLLLKKELGIEGDEPIKPEELDTTTQLLIRKLGKNARSEFETIRKSVKVPEKVDLEAQRQKALKDKSDSELRNKPLWERAIKDLPSKFDKIQFKYTDPETKQEIVVYEHEIEADYRTAIEKALPDTADLLAKSGKEYTPKAEAEEVARMQNALKIKYLSENMNKIMYAFKKKLEKEFSDKAHEENHNPQKPNLQERRAEEKPISQQSKDNLEADILRRHGRA